MEMSESINVLGEKLETCGKDPITGFKAHLINEGVASADELGELDTRLMVEQRAE